MSKETGSLQPSQAGDLILKGLTIARSCAVESTRHWISRPSGMSTFKICANGFMLIGMYGDLQEAHDALRAEVVFKNYRAYCQAMSRLTGASERLIRAIVDAHCTRRLSARNIAEGLKSDPAKILYSKYDERFCERM